MSSQLPTLSDTELARIAHASNKLSTLRKLGYKDDAEALLWKAVVEDQSIPFGKDVLKQLSSEQERRSGEECMALFVLLLNTSEGFSYVYQHHRLICVELRKLCHEHTDVLREQHTTLPSEYAALAAILLASQDHIQAFAPEVVPSIARWVLGIEDSWYFSTIVTTLPASRHLEFVDQSTWYQECINLATTHQVEWDSFPQEALLFATDEEFVQLASHQVTRSDAIPRETLRRGERLLPIIEEQYQTDIDRGNALAGPGLLLGWMMLLQDEGRAIPPYLLRWVQSQLRGYYFEPDQQQQIEQAFQLIPIDKAKEYILPELLSYGSCAPRLIHMIEEDDFWREVMQRLEGDNSWESANYEESIAKCGVLIIPIMSEVIGSCSAKLATTCARAIVKMGAPHESLPLLAVMLRHSSKRTREAAAEGLALCGDEAMEVIQEGLLASKKNTRMAALAAIGETKESETRDAVIDAVIDATKHQEIANALARLPRAQQDENTANHLTQLYKAKKLLEEGADDTCSEALRELLCTSLHYELNEWSEAINKCIGEPLAPWVATLQVANYEWLGEYCTAADVRKCMAVLKDALIEPLCELSLGGYNQDVLLTLLATISSERAVPVLLEAIQASKAEGLYINSIKSIHKAAVNACTHLTDDAVASFLPLLKARKKDQRLTAAQVIEKIGASEANDALADAFEKEKVSAVKAALSKALIACQASIREASESFEEMSEKAIDDYLSGLLHIPLPDFLDLRQLPPLVLHQGHTLSPDARWGWVSLIAHETPETPSTVARELRSRFQRNPLDAFGQAIYRNWTTNEYPNSHRWMNNQRAITASTSTLLTQGMWIGESATDLAMFLNHGSRLGRIHVQYAIESDEFYINQHTHNLSLFDPEPVPQDWVDAYRKEQSDHLINSEGFEQHIRQMERDGGNPPTMRLLPRERPSLGKILSPPGVGIDPKGYDEDAHSEEQNTRMRHACTQCENNIEKSCNQIISRLTEAQSESGYRVWTRAGWQRIFWNHMLWELLSRGLLFTDDCGQYFLRSPEGNPTDIDGQTIALDDDAFVSIVQQTQIDALDQQDANRWQQQLDEWYNPDEQELAPMPEDPLFAIRDLLYGNAAQDAWDMLQMRLERWPQDGTIDVALAYIDAHISAWGTQTRKAPAHWTAHLLADDNQRRINLIADAGYQIQGGDFPALQACNHIAFESCDIRLDDAKRIANGQHLQHITHLTLSWGRIYKDADTHLAASDIFPSLETLTLYRVNIRKLGWRTLFLAPWLQRCKHLSLQHMNLDWSKLEALIDTGLLHRLESLDLRNNDIGQPGIEVLLNAGPFPQLRQLQIKAHELGVEGLEAFCASDCFSQLTSLTIESPRYWHTHHLDPNHLANCRHLPNLVELHLSEGRDFSGNVDSRWLNAIKESKTLPQAAIQVATSDN